MAMTAAVAMPSAQTPAASPPSLVGAWTLNKDLSDQPQDGSGGEGREGGHTAGDGRTTRLSTDGKKIKDE